MSLEPETYNPDAMLVEVRVRAGDFIATELTTVVQISSDVKQSKLRIKAASNLLLECLPVAELRELEQKYVDAMKVPVVKTDGSVGTVTPEIERAIREQQKLKRMERNSEPTKPSESQSQAPPENPSIL